MQDCFFFFVLVPLFFKTESGVAELGSAFRHSATSELKSSAWDLLLLAGGIVDLDEGV